MNLEKTLIDRVFLLWSFHCQAKLKEPCLDFFSKKSPIHPVLTIRPIRRLSDPTIFSQKMSAANTRVRTGSLPSQVESPRNVIQTRSKKRKEELEKMHLSREVSSLADARPRSKSQREDLDEPPAYTVQGAYGQSFDQWKDEHDAYKSLPPFGPRLYASWSFINIPFLVMGFTGLTVFTNAYKFPIMFIAWMTHLKYYMFPWQETKDMVPAKTTPGDLMFHLVIALLTALLYTVFIAAPHDMWSNRNWVRLRKLSFVLFGLFAVMVVPNIKHLGNAPDEVAVGLQGLLLVIMLVTLLRGFLLKKHFPVLYRHADLIHYVALMAAPLFENTYRLVYHHTH
jgi:hypothetical protein